MDASSEGFVACTLYSSHVVCCSWYKSSKPYLALSAKLFFLLIGAVYLTNLEGHKQGGMESVEK